MIVETLKSRIEAAEPFTKEQLDELRKSLPRDADVLIEMSKRILEEYSFLMESSIINGVAGNFEEAILHHKLSYQCLQCMGLLMEQARGEGCSEHYLTAKEV